MDIKKESRERFYVDEDNFFFFIERMKQLIPYEKMMKRYYNDLINNLCHRFKLDGHKIQFTKIEVEMFNEMLRLFCITASKLKIIEEVENEEN